jgi:endoglucanase
MNRSLVLLLIIFFGVFSHAQFLTTSGKQILDKNGDPIILRGVGLGGWMLQEPYMMNFVGGADNQQQFRSKLESLIGETNTQEFYDNWLDNFVTKTDIDSIASWGFNSVRLPMHYNLFTLPIEQEDPGQNTWLDKGFEIVDNLLEWCKDNQLYLILDLHAAPGGQGYDQGISDYDTSKPSLWESDANKQKMVALWDKLAERYKNEEWIGGYDILNEPNWNLSGSEIRNLYVQVTNAIRSHDTNHIIFIEGNWFANDYTGLTPPWDDNMVYSFHKYWNVNTQNTIQWVLDMRNQYNIPLWMGESGENSNVWFKEAISLFEDNDIGWAWWPWKRIETTVSSLSITSNSNYNAVVEYFKGNASAPNASTAFQGLLEIAEASKIENCQYRKDVIDAMLRQPSSDELKPFANHSIPGLIHATHYDMGSQGIAYYDNRKV